MARVHSVLLSFLDLESITGAPLLELESYAISDERSSPRLSLEFGLHWWVKNRVDAVIPSVERFPSRRMIDRQGRTCRDE